MSGFASAVNVSYASRGLPRLHLDKLTYDYFRSETTSVCAIPGNSNVSMVSVVFRILSVGDHPEVYSRLK
jgi:hypothetical protein